MKTVGTVIKVSKKLNALPAGFLGELLNLVDREQLRELARVSGINVGKDKANTVFNLVYDSSLIHSQAKVTVAIRLPLKEQA